MPEIISETANGVMRIKLNRPEARNAMSLSLLRELLAALDRAEADPEIRIVAIRGAGGHFSAGADIKDMAAARAKGDGAAGAIREISVAFGSMVARFARSPKTIIAGLEGAVMGGGFGLACASDIAIASHTVKFSLPEASLGLLPAQIAPVLIERIGYSEAKRLTLTAARIGAEEAFRIGLVHAVTQDLDEALENAIAEALQCAPLAAANSKRLLWEARFAPSDSLVGYAADLFVEAAIGAEAAEGTAAFIGKRKPSWSGR